MQGPGGQFMSFPIPKERLANTVEQQPDMLRKAGIQSQPDPCLREIVDLWPEAVILLDARTKDILHANPKAEALFGHPAETLSAQGFELLFPKNKSSLYLGWLRTASLSVQEAVELDLVNHADQTIPVEAVFHSLPPPRERNGIIILRSLVERKQIEAENAAIAVRIRERQRLESLHVLASGIAHDFNNILTSILGYANMGHKRMLSDPVTITYFEEIEKSTLRAGDLCRQILAYAGRGELNIRRGDLNATIQGFEQALRNKLGARANFVFSLSPGVPELPFDSVKVCQAIYSVVQNAAEAGTSNQNVITVMTYLSPANDPKRWDGFTSPEVLHSECVVVEISDTGVGIPAENLPRVFEPFFGTKFIGRGLGLSEAHGILHAHNGAIQIVSKLGSGTTVRLFLPTSRYKREDLAAPLSSIATPSRKDLPKPGYALVADDMRANRDYVTLVLESLGYTVFQASDGMEILQLFDEQADNVSLIVLDLTMPGIPTEQVLWRIKNSSHGETPTIIMSGYTEDEALRRCSPLVPDAYLMKPFSANTLKHTIYNLLHLRCHEDGPPSH